MKIISVEFKNFASYGNRTQVIKFDKDKSDLYLVLGGNGAGKCLAKETEISVEIDDESLRNEFLEFLNRKIH